jgi:hypothetical protein
MALMTCPREPLHRIVLRDRKLEPRTVKLPVSALRFFFLKTLKRRYLLDDLPYPKVLAACRSSSRWRKSRA